MRAWLLLHGDGLTEEDSRLEELVAQAQGTPGPRQREFSPASQAKFVICDYTIETLFSDQKSRGFHLRKSHISDPGRISRLMMAAALAYLWMIYLDAQSVKEGWYKRFHRTDRIDLSLFQLGLRLMEYLLNQGKALLVAFNVPPPVPSQSVR